MKIKSTPRFVLGWEFDKQAISEAEAKLAQIEEQLSSLSLARNMKTVQKHLQSLGANGWRFSETGMRK